MCRCREKKVQSRCYSYRSLEVQGCCYRFRGAEVVQMRCRAVTEVVQCRGAGVQRCNYRGVDVQRGRGVEVQKWCRQRWSRAGA